MQEVEIITDFSPGLEEEITQIVEELYDLIQKVYLADSRPWIVGYSGGKDSTTTLQAIWYALSRLPRKRLTKPVYIISSDTYVETPIVVDYIDRTLEKINKAASTNKMPFEAHKVTPLLKNTFWVNLIGKGYPAPYNKFRWCTDRLKIEPANRFITEKVAIYGEVIVVLGVRRDESASRAGFMRKRKEISGHLYRHSTLPNAWVFSPIEDWYTDEIWKYLLSTPPLWGGHHKELATMYKNAQDGECPLVIDKTTPSCGNSRFGCWTCTVVQKDTSMESMIGRGEEWMKPLLEFRNWLAKTQDPETKKNIRDFRRRSGRVQYREVDGTKKLIWGPYTLEFRKEILHRLLETQELIRRNGPSPKASLISTEELLKIRQIWRFDEGDWQDSLPGIYHKVTSENLEGLEDDWSGMGNTDYQVLLEVCNQFGLPLGLLTELFDAEKRQHGMSRRSAIFNDIDTILKKDWRSRAEVFTETGIKKVDY